MDAMQMKSLSIDFSEKPLEEKTVMFIENYYNGARGVISKLFRAYLTGSLYKDHKFVWVARDYEETLKNFGSLLDDGRVWICVVNGYDYIRFLNTAKYIFTSVYLPGFFIKRDEQMVYYAPLEFFFRRKTYTESMLLRLCPTMNNADRILFEANSEKVSDFAKRFGITGKMKFAAVKPQYGFIKEKGKEKKYIFLSLTDRRKAVKSLGVFQYVYNTITSLAEAYGYEAYWKISLDLYRKYREDEMSILEFKNIYSNESDCRDFIEYADIVISDNYTDVLTADAYCENVIFYYNEDMEYETLQTKNRVMYTSDYARLLDILEMKLDGRESIADTVDMDKVPVLLECPAELCGDCGYGVTEPMDEAETESERIGDFVRILIVLDVTGMEDMVIRIRDIVGKYRTKADITVFFCTASGGRIYDYLDNMYTDIPYMCRAGAIRCSEAEKKEAIGKIDWNAGEKAAALHNRAERVLRDEWTRIAGKTIYDYSVAMLGFNNFWDNMNRFVPAKNTLFFKKKASSEDTFRSMCDVLEDICGSP